MTIVRFITFVCMFAALAFRTTAGIDYQQFKITYSSIPLLGQLPSRCVTAIFADDEGNIWYGTEGGLCCDNGYHITTFRPHFRTDRGMSNNQITCIAAMDDGRIIFGTALGLYTANRYTGHVLEFGNGSASLRYINAIEVMPDSSILVAVNDRIMAYTSDGQLLREIPTRWQGNQTHVRQIYRDHRNRTWLVFNEGGIGQYLDDGTITQYPWPLNVSASAIVETHDLDSFWVGTWRGGLVQFNPDADPCDQISQTIKYDSGDERDHAILHIHRDDQHRWLWITTMNGLKIIDCNGKQASIVRHGIKEIAENRMLTQLTADSFGNIWVAGYNTPSFILSFSDGITSLSLDGINRSSGHVPTISSVCHDDEQNLYWLFQERHRLYLYDIATESLTYDIETDFELTNHNAGSLHMMTKAHSHPGVWIACTAPHYIYRLHQQNRKIIVADRIDCAENVPDAMEEDRNGNLWIATRNGLMIYDIANRNLGMVDSLCRNTCAIHTSTDGTIYVANQKDYELTEVTAYRNRRPAERYSLQYNCSSLATTSGSSGTTVWIGTPDGHIIQKSENGQINDLTLSKSAVTLLTVDTKGHVWALTEQSVTEIDPESMALHVHHANRGAVKLFTFFPHCSDRLPSGQMLFGGTGGLCLFDHTANLAETSRPSAIHISRILVDGKTIVPDKNKHISLNAGSNSIDIEFSSGNHLQASDITYAYRNLNKRNTEWITLPTGINTVHLSQIPSGKYSFEVKCTDENHLWSNHSLAFTIEKLPAIYETWWAITIYVLILLIGIRFGAQKFRRRVNRREKLKMEDELLQLKFRFFTNITHELRTPLTLIITPLQSIISRCNDPKMASQLKSVANNANELLQLINQLLEFRKLEMGGEKLQPTKGDIVESLRTIADNFRDVASSRNIELNFESDSNSIIFDFDARKIIRVATNLLANALKHTSPGDNITMRVSQSHANVTITVSDTGEGMTAETQQHIFDRFYQADGTSDTGTGIGLNLVSEYVRMHSGEITVESAPGQGATFTITLPRMQSSGTENETSLQHDENFEHHPTNHDKHSKLLIIEDNTEFRHFLASELSEQFDVIEAANGAEGMQETLTELPDIIISDVMLPQLNGYELCRNIKSNINTSEIPVILLTARADGDSEIEGYRSGADAYITKPFSMTLLRNRINHLLAQRAQRQQQFNEELTVNPQKLATSSIDEQLLQRILACIENNLGNANYSIAQLSSDVNMNRMNLYRKLQTLTGKTPTDFVKSVRLKRAAMMLLENRHTIVEIAYTVGFSSPSYFTKSFKEEFGVTPSQYIKEHEK